MPRAKYNERILSSNRYIIRAVYDYYTSIQFSTNIKAGNVMQVKDETRDSTITLIGQADCFLRSLEKTTGWFFT